MSVSYSVLRNGFGKTLKPVTPVIENTAKGDKVIPVDVTASITFEVGDRVKFIDGVEAIYSNAHEGVRVPDWVKKSTYTIQSKKDDRVLLKEIYSWTYIKYLQKA